MGCAGAGKGRGVLGRARWVCIYGSCGLEVGCSGSEGSQYPRPKLLVTAMKEVALVKNTPGCVESV